jgi:hypothetical protein
MHWSSGLKHNSISFKVQLCCSQNPNITNIGYVIIINIKTNITCV